MFSFQTVYCSTTTTTTTVVVVVVVVRVVVILTTCISINNCCIVRAHSMEVLSFAALRDLNSSISANIYVHLVAIRYYCLISYYTTKIIIKKP